MSTSSADRENELIDVDNTEHIEYWTKEFGISAETLKKFIKLDGNVASELRIVLGK